MRTGKGKTPTSTTPHARGGMQPADGTRRLARFERLDALRGLALLWMAFFHFCFDLSTFRLIQADFYRDPLWTTQRTCILSLFLLCAGAGQAVATHQGQTWARFWRRWAQILGCAMLVSIGSAWMFPRSFIYFGVLHGMAVMLIVARLSAPLGPWLWPIGAVALAVPHFFGHPVFDSPWLNWTGLITHKPITEDYVPVLPWIGVMFWGLAGTQWILQHHPGWMSWASSAPGAHTCGDNTAATRASVLRPPMRFRQGLATLGQWSLTFYMLHQPVLIGLLQAWMAWQGRPPH